MKQTDEISQVIRELRVPASAGLDERVHAAIRQATPPGALTAVPKEPGVWTILKLVLRAKAARYTLAATLVAAVVVAVFFHVATTPAWAIEEAIEALQKYRAVHITGQIGGNGKSTHLEVWARADSTGTRSDDCLTKSDSVIAWVKNNRTYWYDLTGNKVFVDSAITMGVNPWLGPKLLTTLSKARDYKAVEGFDPTTGQKRVVLTCSAESVVGPQSFLIEFDGKTKLPVSMKHWPNLKRRGPPAFSFERIIFFEDLPDSIFNFEPPPDVQFVDKELTIPEANLPMLTDPKQGVSVEGLSREEACRKILEQLWTAAIKNDLARIRQLCPIAAAWSDELLLDMAEQDDPVELLEIGGIEKEGQSKLGPLALVPSRVRCKDGKIREVKMVVQFHQTERGASCVIHGPYGYSVEVK